MQSVYYLTHRVTERRLKWYKTLAGARIAQRARNHKLGFVTRLERVQQEHREMEFCQLRDHTKEIATWVIEEDTVDSPDLIQEHTDAAA